MFNNLIESCSHRNEVQRRSYFFAFTTISYALLLSLAGLASVYAYDAHLKAPEMRLTLLTFGPTDSKIEITREKPQNGSAKNSKHFDSIQPFRPVLIDSSANPNNPPDNVGTTAPAVPEAHFADIKGNVLDPPGFSEVGNNFGATPSHSRVPIQIDDAEPPPDPTPSPKRILRTTQVLNGLAIDLPKPAYPAMAKIARVEGIVSVQVLIDETGKVISAKALSGSPLLQPEAIRAAYGARFSPTTINEQPVKVSGLITYNFLLH